jgi:hypothetical protein
MFRVVIQHWGPNQFALQLWLEGHGLSIKAGQRLRFIIFWIVNYQSFEGTMSL